MEIKDNKFEWLEMKNELEKVASKSATSHRVIFINRVLI